MTLEQKSVLDWMLQAEQKAPPYPCIPEYEVRYLRAKLILEECLETINALGFKLVDMSCNEVVLDPVIAEDVTKKPDIVKIADGCEDIKVVTEGTLIACGLIDTRQMIDDPLFTEVMLSNFSKFPFKKDEHGKVLKSENYFLPNLTGLIQHLNQ